MADNNLPPPHEHDTQETPSGDIEITRPNAPAHDTEKNVKHKTELLGKADATREHLTEPTGSHVIPTQQSRRRQPPPSYSPRPRRQPKSPNQENALYLPWWSIVLMLLAVLIVSFGILGGIYFMGNTNNLLAEPSPIIVIVTADQSAIQAQATQAQAGAQGVTSTEIITGQNAPQDLALTGPTLAPIQLSPTPAAIQIGSVVVVEGVDLNTLNVRDIPSLTASNILFRAEEGEIFNVLDGPQQSDGFTWWQIQDPADVNRIGWAVSNFLTVQPQ